MPSLFDPVQLGELNLPNRIIMAPLTRNRASGDGRVPNDLMRQYYVQRALAGLILTEATSVMPSGVGYPHTPGIWSKEQTNGWRQVVNGVHDAGGRILMQLWHVGRISDPSYHEGALPVAPSPVAPKGHVSLLRPERPYVTPRTLETHEIGEVVEGFRQGALNALLAGFDGVEIHGANGYLLDQFLQDSSNRRTDRYGGRIENRARLMLEVTDAVVSVWGAGRVGMHLAPRCDSHDMGDSNPSETFGYVARELGKRGLAFIFARESLMVPRLGPELKRAFGGACIVSEGYTRQTAEGVLETGDADAVAFGKLFISNPDLPRRFRENGELSAFETSTFYSNGPAGYTDYPALSEGSKSGCSVERLP